MAYCSYLIEAICFLIPWRILIIFRLLFCFSIFLPVQSVSTRCFSPALCCVASGSHTGGLPRRDHRWFWQQRGRVGWSTGRGRGSSDRLPFEWPSLWSSSFLFPRFTHSSRGTWCWCHHCPSRILCPSRYKLSWFSVFPMVSLGFSCHTAVCMLSYPFQLPWYCACVSSCAISYLGIGLSMGLFYFIFKNPFTVVFSGLE